jgi:hypothetical protein
MSPRTRASVAIVCGVVSALFISPAAKPQSNYLIPLPQKGTVIALNNSGQVLYDTGLLTGNTFTVFPAGFTVPTGSGPGILNQDGVVAGNTATGHLASYSVGTVTDLGLPPWQVQSIAPTAINASGQIVGSAQGTPFAYSLFFYSAGVFNPINLPNIGSNYTISATDLNDSGQILLCAGPFGNGSQGYLITGSALTDLGATCPLAINSSGLITGDTTPNDNSGDDHTFIWANGQLTVLAESPPFTVSKGYAINKGGQVVGSMAFLNPAQSGVPFFYNGVMTDINSLVSASDPLKSSVTIGSVVDINDNRLLLVLSTPPAAGSSTAYLLQAPWLDVAPGPLTFANLAVGTRTQPQTLTLTNSGTVPLSLDSISIAPGAPDFSQTNACPQSLAAGANCTVSVTAALSTVGAQSAMLDIVTGGATITVPLAATTPITIILSASPTNPFPGSPFTITWNATPGSTCSSSGGATNGELPDGWSATSTSGSVSVSEANPGTYTYTMTCSAGSVSVVKNLNVVVDYPCTNAACRSSSGGGGVMDTMGLLVLGGLLLRRRRDRLRAVLCWA